MIRSGALLLALALSLSAQKRNDDLQRLSDQARSALAAKQWEQARWRDGELVVPGLAPPWLFPALAGAAIVYCTGRIAREQGPIFIERKPHNVLFPSRRVGLWRVFGKA